MDSPETKQGSDAPNSKQIKQTELQKPEAKCLAINSTICLLLFGLAFFISWQRGGTKLEAGFVGANSPVGVSAELRGENEENPLAMSGDEALTVEPLGYPGGSGSRQAFGYGNGQAFGYGSGQASGSSNGQAQGYSNGQAPLIELPPMPKTGLPPMSSFNAVSKCPLPLDDYCFDVQFGQTAYSLVWQGFTDLALDSAAWKVLSFLNNDGWRLEDYGYLDLFSDAWGCVVSRQTGDASGEVLTITIMPLEKYSSVGPANPVTINVVYLSTAFVKG